jgi:hypothetical protein
MVGESIEGQRESVLEEEVEDCTQLRKRQWQCWRLVYVYAA